MASGADGEDTLVVPNRAAVVRKQEHEHALTLLRLVMETIALGRRTNPPRVILMPASVRKLLFTIFHKRYWFIYISDSIVTVLFISFLSKWAMEIMGRLFQMYNNMLWRETNKNTNMLEPCSF